MLATTERSEMGVIRKVELPSSGAALPQRVVVGVDDTAPSLAAARWAAAEAHRREAVLELVHVVPIDVPAAAVFMPLPMSASPEYVAAGRWLSDFAQQLDIADLVTVERLECGAAGTVLPLVADGAALLVVGAHPHRELFGITRGSTADECLRACGCPVVVVPEQAEEAAPCWSRT